MVLAAREGRIRWPALHGVKRRLSSGQSTYDDKIPCEVAVRTETKADKGQNAHRSMFFSSGAAQTNGGGSLCMFTYSLVSWKRRSVHRDEGSYWTKYAFVGGFAGH